MLNVFDSHFQPNPTIVFPLLPSRINLYYKLCFPSSPFFIHFKDFSGSRKLHSPYCFLAGVLWIPLLRKCQQPLPAPLCCGPPWFVMLLWGCKLRQSSGLGRAEVAHPCYSGLNCLFSAHAANCSVPRTSRNVAWHFVSWVAGQLDMMPSSVSTFTSKRNEASPKIKQIDTHTKRHLE